MVLAQTIKGKNLSYFLSLLFQVLYNKNDKNLEFLNKTQHELWDHYKTMFLYLSTEIFTSTLFVDKRIIFLSNFVYYFPVDILINLANHSILETVVTMNMQNLCYKKLYFSNRKVNIEEEVCVFFLTKLEFIFFLLGMHLVMKLTNST